MDHDHGVLTRFDDFIQVANATTAHGAGEWAIDPHCFAPFDQIAPHQIGSGEVIVARYCYQGAFQSPRHMFHEARLAATGGAF